MTNFSFFGKIFRKSQLQFIFALVSTLPLSLFQSTKQGKEKALCDALKCCGHEELFPYYLSCNKCTYSWEIQPAEREGEKLCETVTTLSSTLPTRKYKKMAETFKKSKGFGKTVHNYRKKIKI
jgi:hypothetical protein